MEKEQFMKEKGRQLLKGFLTSYALTVVFHKALVLGNYETNLDFWIASIYELLGSYDFRFILVGIVCSLFYLYRKKITQQSTGKYVILSGFFAGCILLGNSYHEVGSWEYCFGSVVNFIKSGIAFSGYSILFSELLSLIDVFFQNKKITVHEEKLPCKKVFFKTYLILLAVYLPFLILSYPGNLCWDVIGQIEQVIFETGYSAHHPIVHTLIVGGFVKAGGFFFHSYEVGLFVYMLFQLALFAAALSATVAFLARYRVKKGVLTGLVLLYAIAPVYSNMASTALKDVPFVSFVIGYMICFVMTLENQTWLSKGKFAIVFILMQLGVILFRNNGIYVILLSGIMALAFWWKKSSAKESIRNIFLFFVTSWLISKLLLLCIGQVYDVAPGSKGEMLSIPFQQTARYLQLYQEELTDEERAAIEAVLGDVHEVAACYNPNISDPVKAHFKQQASAGEILEYFRTWAACLCKHPAVYFEAFFHHIYGWFSPFAENSIRYETQYDVISQEGLFPQAQKLLLFYYRFAGGFTPLGVLENVGVYVWCLCALTAFCVKRRMRKETVMLSPLWVSLLICLASPCFFMHPRYAFPIMFTIPFLSCFIILLAQREKNHAAECI